MSRATAVWTCYSVVMLLYVFAFCFMLALRRSLIVCGLSAVLQSSVHNRVRMIRQMNSSLLLYVRGWGFCKFHLPLNIIRIFKSRRMWCAKHISHVVEMAHTESNDETSNCAGDVKWKCVLLKSRSVSFGRWAPQSGKNLLLASLMYKSDPSIYQRTRLSAASYNNSLNKNT